MFLLSSPWHRKSKQDENRKEYQHGSAIFSFLASLWGIGFHSGRVSMLWTLIMLPRRSQVSLYLVYFPDNKVRDPSDAPEPSRTLGRVQLSPPLRSKCCSLFWRRLSWSELSKLSVSLAAHHYSTCGLMVPDTRCDPRAVSHPFASCQHFPDWQGFALHSATSRLERVVLTISCSYSPQSQMEHIYFLSL